MKLQVFDEFGGGEAAAEVDELLQQAWAADRQAARAWLEQLSHSWESRLGPQDQLFKLLRGSSGKAGDKTVKVVNQARQWIGKYFPFTHTPATIGKDNPRKARCTQYFYYRVLHKLLVLSIAAKSEKCGGGALASKTQDAVVTAVLEAGELQIGLLNCCVEVVNYAYLEAPAETFPTATVALGRLDHTVELWQAIDWVVDVCAGEEGGRSTPVMPQCLTEYLAAMQTRIEEEVAWMDGSSIYARILTVGNCAGEDGAPAPCSPCQKPLAPFFSNTPCVAENDTSTAKRLRKGGRAHGGGGNGSKDGGPDGALMARFFTGLVSTAMARTAVVCRGLQELHPELEAVAGFSEKCCKVMDIALYDELHLMFNQHLSVVIASAIYYVLRVHGVPFSFRKITGFMAANLLNHDDEIFAQAEVLPEGGALALWESGGQAPTIGSARQFYNTVFLAAFASYRASDLFEDSGSGTSQPSTALHPLTMAEEGPPGAAAHGTGLLQGVQLLPAGSLQPLWPLPMSRQQLEAPPSGASTGASGTAGGADGRGGRGVRGVSGNARSKAAGGKGSGRARNPLQHVDGNRT